MKCLNLLFFALLSAFFYSCSSSREMNVGLVSVENNVCKTLKEKVVVYAIFVDTKYTKPWTEYDIHSTIDSIKTGMNWIVQKAMKDSIGLKIDVVYHLATDGKIPIYNEFSRKTLSGTLYQLPVSSGIRDLYRWADRIAAIAGKSFPPDTSRVIRTKNKITDRERLIARLRDIYKTDNIALMYFINNYYMNEISLTLDANSYNNVEFSIVSFKKPSVIAHEFLHLFGAWDLYITPFDKKRDIQRKKKQAMEHFPNEIMAFAYRSLDSLNIGPFTKYTIGWKKQLDPEYSEFILGKNLRPIKY